MIHIDLTKNTDHQAFSNFCFKAFQRCVFSKWWVHSYNNNRSNFWRHGESLNHKSKFIQLNFNFPLLLFSCLFQIRYYYKEFLWQFFRVEQFTILFFDQTFFSPRYFNSQNKRAFCNALTPVKVLVLVLSVTCAQSYVGTIQSTSIWLAKVFMTQFLM